MNINLIKTNHGDIELPAFMPDATYGSIKTISFNDAKKAGVNQIVTTTMHIEQKIGSEYVKQLGGLHKFFNWNRPILTDSGGWQVFSLINKNISLNHNSLNNKRDVNIISSKLNKITEVGCSFIDPTTGNHFLLTAESSQIIQNNLGSDIVTVLDDPIIGNATYSERKESIRINSVWAKRSKVKFDELNNGTLNKPLIGCVIQGGDDFELRKVSANDLLDLDFDLYNFGGIPLKNAETWKTNNEEGFHHEMLEYVAKLIPNNKIKYAMGVGQPEDIAFCVDVGWHLFDTVLPTRNARHGYLYVSEGQGEETRGYKGLNYDIMHLRSNRYLSDLEPVDNNCSCECCTSVSRAYLRHLLRIKESSGLRLATIHNLSFYSNWLKKIKNNLLVKKNLI